MGRPTDPRTILGNPVAPSLLDSHWPRPTSRASGRPTINPPGREHNTWDPVYGSHVKQRGSFNTEAHTHSPELWLSQHRGLATASAGGSES